MVKEYVKEIAGQEFLAENDNGEIVIIKIEPMNSSFINLNGKRRRVNHDLLTKYSGNVIRQETISLIDEAIETSQNGGTEMSKYTHGWLDNNGQNDWEYRKVYLEDKNNTIWSAILNIARPNSEDRILYDITKIKKEGSAVNSATQILPTDIVNQNTEKVNTENENFKKSLKRVDSEGKALTEAQWNYFKDSKIVDDDGKKKRGLLSKE